jgi:hypothetical protein
MRTEQSAFCAATHQAALGIGRMIGNVRFHGEFAVGSTLKQENA